MSSAKHTVTGNLIRKPYHMLGKAVSSYAAAVAAVGFSLVSKPVLNPFTLKPIANEVGVYRSDSFDHLGTGSAKFTYIQPAESLQVLESARLELGSAGHDAQWASVNVLRNGASIAAFTTLDTYITAPKRGDKVGLSIAYRDSFDGTGRCYLQLMANVLACDNGMTSMQSLCSFGAKHNPCLSDRLAVFKGSLAMNLQLQIQGMTDSIAKLDGAPMAVSEVEPFARMLLGVDSVTPTDDIAGPTRNKLQAIVTGFTRGTGNAGRTRWDMFNAVTEYIDHAANYRATDVSKEDNRLESLLTGDASKLRNRAMELLLN